MRAILIFATLATTACEPTIADQRGSDCDMMAVASVVARVRDEQGTAIKDVDLTWTSCGP